MRRRPGGRRFRIWYRDGEASCQDRRPWQPLGGRGKECIVSDHRDRSSPWPSEAIIFVDESIDGGLAAFDLLIEAEHGSDSSAYILTHSRKATEAALSAIPEHWSRMTEQLVEFSRSVLTGKHGGIVLTASLDESYRFINSSALEHLEILSKSRLRIWGTSPKRPKSSWVRTRP